MFHSLWWFILPFHLFSHHLQHNRQRICIPICITEKFKPHFSSHTCNPFRTRCYFHSGSSTGSLGNDLYLLYTCVAMLCIIPHYMQHPKWVKFPESIKWALTAEAPTCPMKGSKNFCDCFLDFRIITSFLFQFWIKLLKYKLVQWLTNDDSQCRHLHMLHCYWKIPL